ncbi:MAG: tetratricopeptide repeat protein [Lewinellaceae bacterium]|nr:tetratricopeptide repeat protein [Phaeodactylibacter sp.]MCB9349135.1 tetratricopeptide repeat protein [Lewinellaceae bacterium]
MDTAQLITEVKELLGNAEMEKALSRLAAFMEGKPEYRQLNRLVLQARAQFQKAQRDELQGLVSTEQSKLNYNQVTRQALQVIEWLEAGNLQPETSFTASRSRLWPKVLGAAFLLLFLVSGGYWWYQSRQAEPAAPLSAACPVVFKASSLFNILIVPFQALNENKLRPHFTIAERLDRLKQDYNIQADLKLYPEESPDSYLITTDDASSRASDCQAQLIIWGTAESFPGNAIIQTRYKFVNRGGQLPLSRLKLTENTELDTVASISSIATSGELTAQIEESIKLLFGLIAHETGNWPVAIEMLEKFETQDSAASLVKGMVLAEDYLASNQEEKAWESYNQVLEQNPKNALARNNRGVLNYKKGNYEEAAEDLSVLLQEDSTDTEALKIRGSAYLKADQLSKARLDLQKARELKAPDRELNQKIEEVDKKIREEEKTKASAEAEIRANPNNLAAWNQKAISSAKLGDYQEAVNAGEAILSRDPGNVDAFVQIIKAYRSAGDTTQAQKTVQRAEATGISRSHLNQIAPFDIKLSPVRTNTIPLKKN